MIYRKRSNDAKYNHMNTLMPIVDSYCHPPRREEDYAYVLLILFVSAK